MKIRSVVGGAFIALKADETAVEVLGVAEDNYPLIS
jgi:hypothetical protein